MGESWMGWNWGTMKPVKPKNRPVATLGYRHKRAKLRGRRAFLFILDQRCRYCLRRIVAVEYGTVDHIYPISRGGSNRDDNTTLACVDCNDRKRDFAPVGPWAPKFRHPDEATERIKRPPEWWKEKVDAMKRSVGAEYPVSPELDEYLAFILRVL